MAGIVQVILTITLNQLYVKKYAATAKKLEEKNVMMALIMDGDATIYVLRTSLVGTALVAPKLSLLYVKKFVETDYLLESKLAMMVIIQISKDAKTPALVLEKGGDALEER